MKTLIKYDLPISFKQRVKKHFLIAMLINLPIMYIILTETNFGYLINLFYIVFLFCYYINFNKYFLIQVSYNERFIELRFYKWNKLKTLIFEKKNISFRFKSTGGVTIASILYLIYKNTKIPIQRNMGKWDNDSLKDLNNELYFIMSDKNKKSI